MDGALVRSKSSSSALVFAEKGTHIPNGGCAGIFLQLFHWNRKLAKKLIFPKKVIPSACSKLGGKKFGEEDRIPTAAKRLLISEENNGGFQSCMNNALHHVRKNEEVKHGSPVLVARLMGLESMPIAHNLEQRKDSHSKPSRNLGKNNSKNGNPVKGSSGSRNRGNPQKFRRTGQFERHPIVKIGADAVSWKHSLYNPRRCQTKPMFSIKGPVNAQGKCGHRLIGAAKKILEPGILPKNRAKCALTYSHFMDKNMGSIDSPRPKSPRSYRDKLTCSEEQSLLRECNTPFEITDSRSKIEAEQCPPTFHENYNQPLVFDLLRDETMQNEALFIPSKRSCGQYTCLGGDIPGILPSPMTPNPRPRAEIHITRDRNRPSPPISKRNHEQRKPWLYMAATSKLEPESKIHGGFLSKPKKKTAIDIETEVFNGREESTLRCEPMVQKRVGKIPYNHGRGAVQALPCSRISFNNKNCYVHKRSGKVDSRCSLVCDGNRDLQTQIQLKGDMLGIFLEQKLNELTHKRGDSFGEPVHKICNSVNKQEVKPVFGEHMVFWQNKDLCGSSDSFARDLSSNYCGSTYSFTATTPSVSESGQRPLPHRLVRSTRSYAMTDVNESEAEHVFWGNGNKGYPQEVMFEQDFSCLRKWDVVLEEVYRAGVEISDGVVSLLLDETLLDICQIYLRFICVPWPQSVYVLCEVLLDTFPGVES